MDARTAQFEGQRERLFALAYRMLGSRSAAEDVVQDTWLRWNDTDTDALEVPEAWLVTEGLPEANEKGLSAAALAKKERSFRNADRHGYLNQDDRDCRPSLRVPPEVLARLLD